jgi:hypothetical protein
MWVMEKARYRSKGLNLLKGEDGKVDEEEDVGRIGRMYVVIICFLCRGLLFGRGLEGGCSKV